MIKQDMYGCDVTVSDNAALDTWNKTLKGFLSHAGSTGPDLVETIKLDPQFAIAQASKGLFSLLLGRRELDKAVNAAHKAALDSDRQNPVTQRERHYINALGAWIEGKPTQSIHEMEQILSKWPHDPLAMKMSHAIRFMLGDLAGMRTSLENIMHVYGGHKAEGYFHGCYSFTLEETGDYELAEKRGRKALEIAPDDAWGLHAITHVFDMTGRAKEGLEWIDGKDAAWEHCNNFRYHVWWHIALMHLDLGNYEKVLELYDEYIRKDKTDDYRDISNATSVLLRLEFEGVETGDRWEELATLSSNRTQDNCVAFADLHYMMALCKTPETDAASLLLSSMSSCAEKRHHCEFTSAIKHPGVLAAEGLEAFRDHDFTLAYECLSKAKPQLQDIGGSHAQRDIFERLGIEAALRGGLTAQAKNLLRERDLHRGHRDGYSNSRWAMIDTALGREGNVIESYGAA
ncbi:MAG: tetratricopeptide repeat protein [Pseudomonadota bacterium]